MKKWRCEKKRKKKKKIYLCFLQNGEGWIEKTGESVSEKQLEWVARVRLARRRETQRAKLPPHT